MTRLHDKLISYDGACYPVHQNIGCRCSRGSRSCLFLNN